MINYEIYEEEEVIRPHHKEKKPKTKKANHKHEYIKASPDNTNKFITYPEFICKHCGKEKS